MEEIKRKIFFLIFITSISGTATELSVSTTELSAKIDSYLNCMSIYDNRNTCLLLLEKNIPNDNEMNATFDIKTQIRIVSMLMKIAKENNESNITD